MARETKPTPALLPKGQKPGIELVLVALSGDDLDPGEEVPVPLHEPLLVGRSAKGLQLTDPLVSIQHAHVYYDSQRGCVVEDLNSATGTWVDEECVRDDSRPIGVGTRLRFGDTQFEVRQVRIAPPWVKWVVGGSGGVVIAAVVLYGMQQLKPPPEPELGCPPSNLGPIDIGSLKVPDAFLRPRGLTLQDLRCTKVEDADEDGRPEAWLQRTDGKGQYVIRPEQDGTWTVMGELPPACAQASKRPAEFPILDCQGETWIVDGGAYRVVDQKGVVVWYRESIGSKAPAPAPATPEPGGLIELPGVSPPGLGPIKVGRFSFKPDDLGRFLSVRGVDRPIHYLICEEAFDGIKYQALNDEDQVVELTVGCISDLRFEGQIQGKPVAIALTPAGRRALVDDVTTFYAGNPDGLFLPDQRKDLVEQISAEPGFLVGSTKLVADTKESDAPILAPQADASRTIASAHVLVPRDSRSAAAPTAWTVPILAQGDAQADPPGCAVLRTHTGPFRSYGFGFSKTFLTVEEVGCGEPHAIASIGYTGGVQDVQLPGADIRVVVESRGSSRGFEVARARVSWR